jgi:hypothetical protein
MHEDDAMDEWTLGAVRARNMSLELHCQMEACRRFQVFDLDRLIESVGEGYLVADIPDLSCESCGSVMVTRLALASFPQGD